MERPGGDEEVVVTSSGKRPEKEVAAKKKTPRPFRARKPKDMPRRPLSAYNIFFKEERARLLAERQAHGAEVGGEKIGFERMAKTVGKRWKELTPEELERFKSMAKTDTERYRNEMEAYNHELALKGRREREEASRKRLEEAGIQSVGTSAPAGLPAPQHRGSLALGQPNNEAMGHFAESHFQDLIAEATASSSAQLGESPTAGNINFASSRLDQLIAQALKPPGLQGLLATPAERSASSLQQLLSSLGQQQGQTRVQSQQQFLGQNNGITQARTTNPVNQSMWTSTLSQTGNLQTGNLPASQNWMTSLPRMQQQLLLQTLQAGNSSNRTTISRVTASSISSSQDALQDQRRFPF